MKSIDNVKKSKIGRPSVDTEAITLRLPRELLESIDGFRRHAMDLPSRPEAIRRLLRAGMDVSMLAENLLSQIDLSMTYENPQLSETVQKLEKRIKDLYVAAQSGPAEETQ